jgi:Protein of unknown function (DUF2934)
MHDSSEEQIRIRAYQLWELAGRPFVNDDRFWREADSELKSASPRRNASEEMKWAEIRGCSCHYRGPRLHDLGRSAASLQ